MYDDCDDYDEDGNYVECEYEEPEVIPKPPNDSDDSANGNEQLSTSNNILPPTFTTPLSENKDNDRENSETNVLPNTQPNCEGNRNQEKYILIAVTSVILSFLLN